MYKLDSESYFSHVREDIISSLKGIKVEKVLEVGAGGCGTIVEIKKRGIAKHVTAAELFTIQNSLQSSPLIDQFLKLDLNTEIQLLPDNEFDVVIAADVLEHLLDPWSAMKELSKKIKVGGIIVISLPNIRNVRTLAQVAFKGSFKYQDEGILDKTHLRFFCKKDMSELIESANVQITDLKFSCDSKTKIFSYLPQLLRELISYQIIHIAKKS